ncbi:hypothetical protein AAHA92_10453 [Salvia divinorum]|uniref:Uncharacterized protein n=1 Tax=Salvia divinorum TaxID=28513 RepID=A0ABD1HUT8_SALDI
MGLERIGWMQSNGRKECRRLVRRIKAAIKKAMRKGSRQQLRFQYDPQSYALNFDEGIHQQVCRDFPLVKFRDSPEITVSIYVVWVD